MYADSPHAARDMRRNLSRLAVFCAVSIALHALTLLAYRPVGSAGAPEIGATTVLQATLTRAATFIPDLSDLPQPEATSEAAPVAAADEQHARAGASDGVALPLPEKWFTAEELDVRAEPLSSVTIDYPEELAGSGIAGRVEIALFIDEHGRVRKAEVTRAVPEGVFDKAAVRAWMDVRFSPAMKDGAAVKSQKFLELSYFPY